MKLAVHDWIHPEPIAAAIERLARYGYDGIEISAEPALHDAGEVARLLELHGLECWGGVTRMTDGRDLVHADEKVRQAGVSYVKDALRFVSDLDGDILTITPSAVGKLEPMGSPNTEWGWCVESLRECQEYATTLGVRLAIEPLNRFETYFVNRCDQALALAAEVGGRLRRLPRSIPHEHRSDVLEGRHCGRGRPDRRRSRRRQQPTAARRGIGRVARRAPRARSSGL